MENSNEFAAFLSKNLSNENFEKLNTLFGSPKMVTMRIKNPKKLTASQISILIELSGLTLDDFKKFIN